MTSIGGTLIAFGILLSSLLHQQGGGILSHGTGIASLRFEYWGLYKAFIPLSLLFGLGLGTLTTGIKMKT